MAVIHPPTLGKLVALMLSATLAGFAVAGAEPEPAGTAADYDQVIARVPADQASIAPVALAELNIALHQAKKQAATALCNGNWFADGEVIQQLGPVPAAPAGDTTVWIYRTERRAMPLPCEHTSRAQFFQEMSRHLPAWISIRPAGQLTGYSQGDALPLPDTLLTNR
jgi:hypothetical protein